MTRYFDFSKGSITSRFEGDDTSKAQTEAVGVGASLSLMSNLLDLTEADWEKIPASNIKDMDFSIASTGSSMVEVESKGTTTSILSGFKKSIEDKKKAARERQRKKKNKSELFGVITRLPTSPKEKAKCYLLDPPATTDTDDPSKHKLLARLTYYGRELRMLLGSQFLIGLANRIQDIERIRDYEALNAVSLINSLGDTYTIPLIAFQRRSVNTSHSFFGEVFPLDQIAGTWFYYGFDAVVMQLMIDQNFSAIRSFKSDLPDNLPDQSTILCRPILDDLRFMGMDPEYGNKTSDPNRREFRMKGKLEATDAGRVFGILKPTKESNKKPKTA
jgi:hypothetical protein